MDPLRIDYRDKYKNKNLGNDEYRGEHVLVAEKALGRRLPKGAEVHHVDGTKRNNNPENLVICPSRAYHALIHARQRALEACGDANKLRCYLCKQYDDLVNLFVYTPKGRVTPYPFHRACQNEYARNRTKIKNRRTEA